jgi:hypothetical protein
MACEKLNCRVAYSDISSCHDHDLVRQISKSLEGSNLFEKNIVVAIEIKDKVTAAYFILAGGYTLRAINVLISAGLSSSQLLSHIVEM